VLVPVVFTRSVVRTSVLVTAVFTSFVVRSSVLVPVVFYRAGKNPGY
jgi:hypothetical protein